MNIINEMLIKSVRVDEAYAFLHLSYFLIKDYDRLHQDMFMNHLYWYMTGEKVNIPKVIDNMNSEGKHI